MSECRGSTNLSLSSPHGHLGGPTWRSSKGGWTREEDDILRGAVQYFKGKNWKRIGKRTNIAWLLSQSKLLLIHREVNVTNLTSLF